jgi:UDP-GlcNAc:undecaprenyl-phosphate GlcNAc-1-phosphate transferase
LTPLLSLAVAMLTTLVLSWPLRRVALRFGVMDHPGPRKGHGESVPYLGGLALLAGVAAAILVVNQELWPVLVLLTLMSALGLIDDLRYMPPWAKLVGEIAIASSAVALGFSWHLTNSVAINDGLSILWMVGLTNSFNLLDNMDGLASTASACSLIALAIIVPASWTLALPLAGAAIGFLVVNRPPAKMFMGDTGSLMIGFGVAVSSIAAANSEKGLHSLVILAFPMALAIFDTSLVIVSRLASGRPVQLGGQDHFSHRLRLMGWSPYQILAAAFVGCFAGSACGALAISYPSSQAWLALPMGLAFIAAWAGLLRVDPYVAVAKPRVEVYGGQTRT